MYQKLIKSSTQPVLSFVPFSMQTIGIDTLEACSLLYRCPPFTELGGKRV